MDIFFERLRQAPAASKGDEAKKMLDGILNEVEDEHSGVPFSPSNEDDGRMYPAQPDSERVSDIVGARKFRHRGHYTYVSSTGAIRIVTVEDRRVLLDKADANGKLVD